MFVIISFFFFFLAGEGVLGELMEGQVLPNIPLLTPQYHNHQQFLKFPIPLCVSHKIQFNLHTLFLPVHSGHNAAPGSLWTNIPLEHAKYLIHLDLSHLLNVCNRSLRDILDLNSWVNALGQRGLVFGWAPMGLTATKRSLLNAHTKKRRDRWQSLDLYDPLIILSVS